MSTLYSIKPKGDGYHILGCTLAGKFFLIRKDDDKMGWKGELTFKNIDEVNEFIAKYNLNEDYEPEEFFRNDKYYNEEQCIETQKYINNIKFKTLIYCPDCGHSLRCMCTIGADKSTSGFSESLYHCENDDCANDFNIVRDADGRFVKMTRHFWG